MAIDKNSEKLGLYILSLWFLFILIIVITIDIPICFNSKCNFIGFQEIIKRNWVPCLALFFIVFGIVYYQYFDCKLKGSKSNPVKVYNVKNKNYEHLTFLTTYIIPLIGLNLKSERYIIILGLLLIIIGLIYIKTNKFYVNPTLAILGFHLYSAIITHRNYETEEVILISKDRLRNETLVQFLELDDGIFYARIASRNNEY